jgi:hypothetical protein
MDQQTQAGRAQNKRGAGRSEPTTAELLSGYDQCIEPDRGRANLRTGASQLRQLTDTASLLTALGGGWWNDKMEAATE